MEHTFTKETIVQDALDMGFSHAGLVDVSTLEVHRGKKLATACIARMLQDCMKRGITVHWDAQNDVSRHLAEKFGFMVDQEYSVYWLPASCPDKTKQSKTGRFR